MNPAQGKIIGKSANAQISLQPGQDLPVYVAWYEYSRGTVFRP